MGLDDETEIGLLLILLLQRTGSHQGYGAGSRHATAQPAGPSQDRASAKSGEVHLAAIVRSGKQALESPWPVAGRAPQPESQLTSLLG